MSFQLVLSFSVASWHHYFSSPVSLSHPAQLLCLTMKRYKQPQSSWLHVKIEEISSKTMSHPQPEYCPNSMRYINDLGCHCLLPVLFPVPAKHLQKLTREAERPVGDGSVKFSLILAKVLYPLTHTSPLVWIRRKVLDLRPVLPYLTEGLTGPKLIWRCTHSETFNCSEFRVTILRHSLFVY